MLNRKEEGFLLLTLGGEEVPETENDHIGGTESRALNLRVQQTGCESWLDHLRLGEPGARSLSLCFLICKVGMITSKGWWEDRNGIASFPCPRKVLGSCRPSGRRGS